MASQAGSQSGASTGTTGGGLGIWEWFWRGRTLAAARESNRRNATRRERVRRAELAAELADRQLEATEALPAGTPLPLALSLYREAIYWGLVAESAQPAAASLSEAFSAANAFVAQLGFTAEELASLRASLIDKTFSADADERPEQQRHQAALAQRFMRALQSHWDADDAVARALFQRGLRTSLLLLIGLCGLLMVSISVLRWWQGPDLAAGKPWRSSSHAYECHPKHNECGAAKTAIFFHTNEEDSPWVEIDLGAPREFARIQVSNRDDCCIDRAVPLVAEVSNDQKRWQRVAREVDSFRQWDATFAPVHARYVRVRVDRHSTLHLVKVSVRAR